VLRAHPTTRRPGSDQSRVKSSTIARDRTRRPSLKQSDTKSRDHRVRQRRTHAQGAFAGATLAHLQLLCTVKPSKAFDGSCAIPLVLAAHASGDSRSDVAYAPVPESATARRCRRHGSCGSASMRDPPQYPARPPLAHSMHRTGMSHGLPFGGGRHH
jgi:hypothetical protein